MAQARLQVLVETKGQKELERLEKLLKNTGTAYEKLGESAGQAATGQAKFERAMKGSGRVAQAFGKGLRSVGVSANVLLKKSIN